MDKQNYLQLTLKESIKIIISLLIYFFKDYFHTLITLLRISVFAPQLLNLGLFSIAELRSLSGNLLPTGGAIV